MSITAKDRSVASPSNNAEYQNVVAELEESCRFYKVMVEEHLIIISALKDIILCENEERKRSILDDCEMCRETANLVVQIFKDDVRKCDENCTRQTILRKYKHARQMLFKHIQMSACTDVTIDGDDHKILG